MSYDKEAVQKIVDKYANQKNMSIDFRRNRAEREYWDDQQKEKFRIIGELEELLSPHKQHEYGFLIKARLKDLEMLRDDLGYALIREGIKQKKKLV